jgi:hypothetical protein
MSSTPNLGIDYMTDGQAGAYIVVNDALNIIDALIQLSIKDRDLATPPASPANGDRYLVVATATGAWTGQEGKIAAYYDGWIFITPKEGFSMWVDDEDTRLDFNGSNWL